MAKEWYLMERPNSYISGYEKETFDDYAEDSLLEVLNSHIGTTVELYNYDLTERRRIRAIVQNRMTDTKLKSLIRHMITPIGTVKAGTYVKYKDRFWIVVNIVDDNGLYEKSVMTICNHILTWLNQKGEVVQRWANVASASQYNNGETSTRNYFVRSDQLIVITPDDDECVLLSSGQRFVMDRRCKVYEREYNDAIVCDTSKPIVTYKITRVDSLLYNYGDSGHFEFMLTQDEQQEQDGYYRINGEGYWLCNAPNQTHDCNNKHCEIDCDSSELYYALEPSEFSALFYNDYGELEEATATWNIDGEMKELLKIDTNGSSISIYADDRRLLNKRFILSLTADGYETVTKELIVKDFI